MVTEELRSAKSIKPKSTRNNFIGGTVRIVQTVWMESESTSFGLDNKVFSIGTNSIVPFGNSNLESSLVHDTVLVSLHYLLEGASKESTTQFLE